MVSIAVSGSILIASWIFYLAARQINRFFGYAFIFVIFLFAFIVGRGDFSLFYLIMFIVAILLSEMLTQVESEVNSGQIQFNTFKLTGVAFTAASVALGAVMYATIQLINSFVGANIIGIPDLAVTTSDIASAFSPTFVSLGVAITENLFAFTIFEILLVFGLFIPVAGVIIQAFSIFGPMFIAAILMGGYHVAAFSVSFSLLLWASLAFFMFIASKFYTGDSTSADVAHGINNAVVQLNKLGLQVV